MDEQRLAINNFKDPAPGSQSDSLNSKQMILTSSAEQVPSSKPDSHSDKQEIPCLLWNPKIHESYRIKKNPELVSILSHTNPVQALISYGIYFRSVLILSSHLSLGLSRCLFFSSFPAQNYQYAFLTYSYVLHAPSISP
jgi:hypothetical protein